MKTPLLLLALVLTACSDSPQGPDASAACSVVRPPPAATDADRLVELSKPANEPTVFLALAPEDEGRRLRVYDTMAYGDWLSGSLLFVGPDPERAAIYGSAGQICAADFAALVWTVPPGAAGVILDLNPRDAELFVTAVISDLAPAP
jgi:hypothetical protein